MKIVNRTIDLQTAETLEFINITAKIQAEIKATGVKEGLVNIQSLHTTMAVIVNEDEPLLIDDMKKLLEELAPSDRKYAHDDFKIRTVNLCKDECANGQAHNKAIHLPTSVMLNVTGGKLQLGTWQQVLAVELDRSRPRQVALQIIGT